MYEERKRLNIMENLIAIKTDVPHLPPALVDRVVEAVNSALTTRGQVESHWFDPKSRYLNLRVNVHDSQPPTWIAGFLTGIAWGILHDNFIELR